MNYLINRLKVDFKVKEIRRVHDGFRLVGHIPGKEKITLLAHIKAKKLESREMAKGQTYLIEGFVRTKKFMHDGRTYLTEVSIDDFWETPENTSPRNDLELVGVYKDKDSAMNFGKNRSVMDVHMTFLSDNLDENSLNICVWNKAIEVFDYINPGTKIHLACFVQDMIETEGGALSLRLSAYKVTALS